MRQALITFLFVATVLRPSDARAQVLDAAAGLALGFGGGGLVSAAWITAEARAGRYIFSPDVITWQLAPIPLGAAAGGLLGYRNPDRLWAGVGAGALGLVTGAGVGALAGALAWEGSEGVWAGAVIGGATGLLIGTVVGTIGWERDGPSMPLFALALPLGP